MKVTGKAIIASIKKDFSAVTFIYNGKNCGVDFYAEDDICVWYGETDMHVQSFDEVIHTPFFDGKILDEIAANVEDIDWSYNRKVIH